MAATQVTANLNLQLTAAISAVVDALNTRTQNPSFPSLLAQAFANGSAAANKVNQYYMAARTLSGSGSEDLDLYALGAVTDAGGNAYTMATIKAIIIQNTNTTEANTITIGNKAATSGWTSMFVANTDSIVIPGGATIIYISPGATGAVVGASTTNHLLHVVNNAAGSVTYNIWIIGATA